LKPIPEAKTHVSVPVTRKSKNIMRPRTSQPASLEATRSNNIVIPTGTFNEVEGEVEEPAFPGCPGSRTGPKFNEMTPRKSRLDFCANSERAVSGNFVYCELTAG